MSASKTDQTLSTIPEPVEQHSITRSLALHLLPGVFILVLFVASAPLVIRAGFPPMFAITTIGITFGLGFQVWHLYNEGRKRNGKWSLEGIVLYRNPLPLWQYFVLIPLFVVIAFIIDGLTGPIKAALLNQLPWLPEWFELRNISLLAAYPRPVLVITFACYLLLNGIAAPLVEELYFRGYLMPRLSRFGRWTPVIETALFTIYHFWQPYYWITQFFFRLPLVCVVFWKRNIKLGILVHMTLNLLGGLLTMALVFGK